MEEVVIVAPRNSQGGTTISHPQPRKVWVYSETSFGSNAPIDKPFFEYETPGPIDFMRYRMNRIWNKTDVNGVEFVGGEPPIKLSRTTPTYAIEAYTKEDIPGTFFRKREEATIQYNVSNIDKCGLHPEPPIEWPQDKWIKVLDDEGNIGLSTIVQPLDNHGIISTFPKLRVGDSPIEFQDCVFDYEAPLNKKDVGDNFYGSLAVNQAEIKPVYNFYVQSYESILTQENPNDEPPESMLPSLYSFLSVMGDDSKIERDSNGNIDPDTVNTIFEKHITLDNAIKEARVATEVTYNAGARSQTVEADVSKGQYFDKYAYAWVQYLKSRLVDTTLPSTGPSLPLPSTGPALTVAASTPGMADLPLADRFKHQIVPISNIEMFSSFNPIANRFPMHCEINFSTSNTSQSEVVKLFEDTEMMAMFIKDYVDGAWGNPQNMGFNFLSSDGLPFKADAFYTTPSFKPYENKAAQTVDSGSLKSWDISDWIDQINTTTFAFGQVQKGVFLGKFDQEVEAAIDSTNPITTITRNLMSHILKAKLTDLKNTKTRSWKDIIGGNFNWGTPTISPKTAYHETVFYHVEKLSVKADGTPGDVLQNFYFPNSTKLDEHHFTDTQVKYGKKYIYRIYAMEMVFGTKYNYVLDVAPTDGYTQTDKIAPEQARICIISEPSVKMIKVPYYQKDVIMMDDPPVWPDVDVITYKDVRDEILFWLTGNAGEYDLKPIMIQDGDEDIINSIRLAQEVSDIQPIRFKSDDHPRYFEAFRIDKKPTKYSDFRGSKIAHIDTGVNLKERCKLSTSGEWIDKTIQPNKKYYYIFRTLDNHGHFSNPSPVYELEMVYDGFAPFLLRDVYYLEENPQPPMKAAKKFTKYIYIKPALAQRVINEQTSGLKNEKGEKIVDDTDCLTRLGEDGTWIQLGTADETLWNKAMKIRVISRKTGKRIDLNIKFTKTHTKLDIKDNNNLC